MIVALLVALAAWADCPDPDLDPEKLRSALDDATTSFDDGDLGGAARTMNHLASSLPCLDVVVDRTDLARFERLMGLVAFYGQEEELAVRWGLGSRLVDPGLGWRLVDDHPYRELVEGAAEPPVGRVDGARLDPPPGGAVFVDGALALVPEAHAETSHLVQVLDRDAAVVGAWWQDGSVFPDEVLADGEGASGTPAWWVDGRVVADAKGGRPKAPREGGGVSVPVVPVAVTGGLAATSIVTYVLAGAAASSLPEQTSADGLTHARTTANTFAVVSGLTAAGAVGVGVGGVLVSAGGARIGLRF